MTATTMKNLIGKPQSNHLGDLEEISKFRIDSLLLEIFSLYYLQKNPNTHTNVVNSICTLIGRIVKMCWLKDLRQRNLLKQLNTMFDDSFFMQKVKMELLLEIVTQMNQFLPGTILSFAIVFIQ